MNVELFVYGCLAGLVAALVGMVIGECAACWWHGKKPSHLGRVTWSDIKFVFVYAVPMAVYWGWFA